MQTDTNLCPECGTKSPLKLPLCPACSAPVVLDAGSAIEFWRLGEVRPAVLAGMARAVSKAFNLPVVVQPSFLDPRPSRRPGWNGVSATAIHEIGHNCELEHHGYDEVIACVMTADTQLDCLEGLDEGTHKFCRACQRAVNRKLAQWR